MELRDVVRPARADWLLLHPGDDVKRVRGPVDDWRAGDAEDRIDVGDLDVLEGDGRDALRRVDETVLPEHAVVPRARGRVVGVEGLDAVVLGGHEHALVTLSVAHPQLAALQ